MELFTVASMKDESRQLTRFLHQRKAQTTLDESTCNVYMLHQYERPCNLTNPLKESDDYPGRWTRELAHVVSLQADKFLGFFTKVKR